MAGMRLLFDGFWWQDGPLANRTVQRAFITAWARRYPEDDVLVALRKNVDGSDLPASVGQERTNWWPHAVSNRWELPRIARRIGADAIVAHNYSPAFGSSLVFIHDVMFEEHPEWFSPAERTYFAPMLAWARRAAVVAASTRTEAARISRHAPSLPSPVVTGLGIPPAFAAPMRRPTGVDAEGEFALTVGRLNVRKNLETIMLAAARAGRITVESPLYIVGGTTHSGVGSNIPSAAQSLLDDGRIVMLGAVPDDELSWLYAHSSLTISLSLDEGFGMPAVEAAAFGSPLLVSDIPVYRETVGDVAMFVDPLNVAAVAAAIDSAWGDRSRADLRKRSMERYSWDRAVDVMREALA